MKKLTINEILTIFNNNKLNPKKVGKTERGKTYVFEYPKNKRVKILTEMEDIFKKFTKNVKYNLNSTSSVGQLEIEGYTFKCSPSKSTISDGTHYEHAQIENLNKQLNEIKMKFGIDYVPILYNNQVYLIKECKKTKGTPKSDFHLVDKNNKAALHISHKAGRTAKDFQQWGGISNKYPIIHNDAEVQDFISKVKGYYGESLKSGDSAYFKITSNSLKGKAVYGPDYKNGSKTNLGEENVHYVLQGNIDIVKKPKGNTLLFELKASAHMLLNGDTIDGSYEPVLGVTFRAGRPLVDIKNCRGGIYPIGFRNWKNTF